MFRREEGEEGEEGEEEPRRRRCQFDAQGEKSSDASDPGKQSAAMKKSSYLSKCSGFVFSGLIEAEARIVECVPAGEEQVDSIRVQL